MNGSNSENTENPQNTNVFEPSFLESIGIDSENIGLIISEADKIRDEFNAAKASYDELISSVRRDKIHSALKNAGAKSIAAAEALLDRDKLNFDGISVNGLDEEISRIKNENNFLFHSASMPYVVEETKGKDNSSAVIRSVMGL